VRRAIGRRKRSLENGSQAACRIAVHDDFVTTSPKGIAATFIADVAGQLRHHHISLMHGWLPIAAQVAAGAVLVAAVGWRNRRWRFIWLPLAILVGVGLTVATFTYVDSEGLAGDPAPKLLWIWTTLAGAAVVVLVAGWRSAQWWRRGMSALAVPLSLLCAALAVNLWVGYFPTVQAAWNQLTAGPLPDQTDQATVVAMQQARKIPTQGTVVPVDIAPTASGFKHRGELVYLPPAWFATDPAPKLPTLMMIGGEFNTPADWLRTGNAIKTMDDFAAAHGGNAPVMVFVDSGGAFNNDTECVNGSRGNAADHLTKDVVPFMEHDYGVSADRKNWGVVGWSMGGTCAADLTVMHPDMFRAFVDIAGDVTPNAGTHAQTVQRLFGGSEAAYADFDPTTVMNRHGTYRDVAGWFDLNSAKPGAPPVVNVDYTAEADAAAHTAGLHANDQAAAANSLCATGSRHGIDCAIVQQPGKHDWPFAASAFVAALPWLAGHVGTPGVPDGPLPKPPTPITAQQVAAR
jgi:S-formylglutathione hydrolase FrmB